MLKLQKAREGIRESNIETFSTYNKRGSGGNRFYPSAMGTCCPRIRVPNRNDLASLPVNNQTPLFLYGAPLDKSCGLTEEYTSDLIKTIDYKIGTRNRSRDSDK